MKNPILNKMNTVFVHVSNLHESVRWYSRLLSLRIREQDIHPPVYNIEIDSHTGLTLDAGPKGMKKKLNPSPYPIFNFHTDDINRGYDYVKELGYLIVSEIVRFDDFSYFQVVDPDGNIIMICTG
ncbi:VOC family protein [Falsibacillus pallidus]|uniref:VOC family protein n=1 Tax=Falsibacillus pallidus TaxID=493781 RepID=UPI003D973AE3